MNISTILSTIFTKNQLDIMLLYYFYNSINLIVKQSSTTNYNNIIEYLRQNFYANNFLAKIIDTELLGKPKRF